MMMLLPTYLTDISKKYSANNFCGYIMSIVFGNALRYWRYFKEIFNNRFRGTSCVSYSGLCLGIEKMRCFQSVFKRALIRSKYLWKIQANITLIP